MFEISKKTVIITIMKKLLTAVIIILGLASAALAEEFDNIQLPMRDYDGIELPAGTFIPIINTQEISTEYCPEGYKVKFIATNDLFLHETNIIPKGTEFFGYVEEIHEPVIGTNASMKIRISKMLLSDTFEIPIRGYIYTSNDNLIGGGLSAPAEYIKVPHFQQRFQGRFWSHRGPTLQIRPGGKRLMGEHTKVNAGEEGLIILTAPAYITHTLTN